MTPEKLDDFASRGFNRVPLTREVLADFDTPLSTYLKLADEPYTYIFESVEGGNKWGRYSFIGLGCKEVIKFHGDEMIRETDGKEVVRQHVEDPFKEIERFFSHFKVAELDEGPRFNGGLVGYFGYDTVRYTEKSLKKSTPEDTLDIPDILLMVSDNFIVFDNLSGTIRFVTFVDPGKKNALEEGEKNMDAWLKKLRKTSSAFIEKHLSVPVASPATEADTLFSMDKEKYKAAVEKIRSYTHDGDVMQVVLSHRMTRPFKGEPVNVYRALRTLNPSPYMYFINLGDFHVVGSSPEILNRFDNGNMTVRPLAGTRKRGQTDEEDERLEQELLHDPKEISEHLMLIDLGRNDLGKVAETGTVTVTEKMVVERYSHVMHISSTVQAKARKGLSALDLLVSALPAGTLSGAPKVRAMEIIDELETVKRGLYGGAVGYLSWNGKMDMAIALRTAIIKGGKLHNQAGAGVVNDSCPESEWEETLNKSAAIFRAQEMAEKGL